MRAVFGWLAFFVGEGLVFGGPLSLEGEGRCGGGGVVMCLGCNGGKDFMLSPSPVPFLCGKGREKGGLFLWGRGGVGFLGGEGNRLI